PPTTPLPPCPAPSTSGRTTRIRRSSPSASETFLPRLFLAAPDTRRQFASTPPASPRTSPSKIPSSAAPPPAPHQGDDPFRPVGFPSCTSPAGPSRASLRPPFALRRL